MSVFFYIFIFVLGLVLLVWGSNLFVDSAVTLANRFHLSEVLIGATIVSLGTTLPETLFSTIASVQGFSEMALGNALGSIMCNTGLIAGMMLLLHPISLKDKELRNIRSGTIFLAVGFFVYLASGRLWGGLSRLSGILLLLIFILFTASTIYKAVRQDHHMQQKNRSQVPFGISDVIRLFLEAAAIYIGADILVKYGPKLARAFGIPEMVISLTFVALGTSLPELVTSFVALKKEHSALSLGNIIGANILNFSLVGGISAVISPITYPNHIMTLELVVVGFLLFLLCVPSLCFKKTKRVQALLMMGGYIIYLFMINR